MAAILAAFASRSALSGGGAPRLAPPAPPVAPRTPLPKPAVDPSAFHGGSLLRDVETDADAAELEPWEASASVWWAAASAEEEAAVLSGTTLGRQEAQARDRAELDRILALQLAQEESYRAAVADRRHFREQLALGRGASSPRIQTRLLPWYEDLQARVERTLVEVRGGSDSDYAPLLQVAPEKIATITLTATLNECLARLYAPKKDELPIGKRRFGPDPGAVPIKTLALAISESLHLEACRAVLEERMGVRNVQRLLDAKTSEMGGAMPSFQSARQRVILMRQIRASEADEEHAGAHGLRWSRGQRAKVGAMLLRDLLEVTTIAAPRTADAPSGDAALRYDPQAKGVTLDDGLEELLSRNIALRRETLDVLGVTPPDDLAATAPIPILEPLGPVRPKHLPMVVKPLGWRRGATTFAPFSAAADPTSPDPFQQHRWHGGYLETPIPLVRLTEGATRSHQQALERAAMPEVVAGLNALSGVPWRINAFVYGVVRQAEAQRLAIAELPTFENHLVPVVPAELKGKALREAEAHRMKVEQHNANLHSLRCTLALKLGVAERMEDADTPFYFPHNVDFRGRAYPVPPHLNYMGDDLGRGLLAFAEGKPLGSRGLFWLKVHLANLVGNNKLSLEDRVAWVDEQMPLVRAAAQNPLSLGPHRDFWVEADEPWQALSVCHEVVSAMEHPGGPESYVSHVPVHQDGTCNGLQHYAALGRDADGARAVNLTPESHPQDVYSDVCDVVRQLVAETAAASVDDLVAQGAPGTDAFSAEDEGEQKQGKGTTLDAKEAKRMKYLANLVLGHVERKVVKQTVMTSVYGVTFIGARDQIRNRLAERIFRDADILTGAQEEDLKDASTFLTRKTMEALGQLFSSAKDIMTWLAQASRQCSVEGGQAMSWVTPLGLPVVQPYRDDHEFRVRTALSRVTLVENTEAVPVKTTKQRTAFPPNFVHSLDSTHMFMTCLAMREADLTFAAVHDSYWTHATDVDEMNGVLRDEFVRLYSQPILEDLHKSLRLRFPHLELADVPERGSLDIDEVRKSTYFFS